MEKTLHQHEQIVQALLQAIPDLVFRLNKDGLFLGFIPAKGQALALPAAEFLGKNVREVLPTELALQTMDYMERALRTGETQTFEYQLPVPLPDGDLHDYEARLVVSGQDEVLVIARDITERKRAEDALEYERRRLFSLLDGLPAYVYLQAADHSVRFANRYFREHFGEPEGKACYEILWGAKEPCKPCPTLHVLETNRPQEWEWTQPDSGRVYQIHDYPFTDVDGSSLVLELGIDITKRKRAEDRLRFLSSAVEQSSEGMAIADLEGNLLFVNNAFATMHGYAPEELIGKRLSVFHTPEQMPAVEVANRQIQETGEFSGEIWHVRRDGTVFPTLMHNSLLRNEAGSPIGMVGTVRDIAQRKRAEEALRESEERLREVLETSRDMVYKLDVDTRKFEYVSPAVQPLTGFTPQEFVGMGFDGVTARIHPQDRPAFRTRPEELPVCLDEARAASAIEYRWQRKDGSYRWLSNGWVLLRDDNGQPRAIVGTVRDITNRKRTDEALQRAREELETRVEERMDGRNTYGLTFRELTVLHLVAAGRADKEIALELGIRPRTVSKHLENILRKMSADCRTEAGVRALREGLVG